VRAGLHTGECELIGEDVGGMAVHIASRICALAQAGEALGVALANVVHVVDVEHVVLGGIYADLAPYLREAVLDQLQRRVITAPWASVDVDVARAGKYPAMTGAALEVLSALVEEPAAWVPV